MLKGSTAVLILDNGKPSFVILGYDSYKNLLSDQENEVKINHSPSQKSADINGGLPRRLPLGEIGVMKPTQEVGSPTGVSAAAASDKFQPDPSNLAGSARFHNRISEKETELLEKINKEILALKNEIDKEEKDAEISAVD